ncbi:MAG: amidohydrolase family protein [Acidobacteria bacterium]|nr:amidohydrolase family protein [Acidobacteriota bacterium]
MMKTMKMMLVLFSLVLLLPGKGQAQTAADLTRKLERLNAYPELIVVNARISTMDAANREVQAMAVKRNRILAVGTNDEIRFLAGPQTEVLDAKGRRVLPGFIDGHQHPDLWAITHWVGAEGEATAKKYNEPQLRGILATGNDRVEVLRSLEGVVRQRAQEIGPGKWIFAFLFAKDTLPASMQIVRPLFQSVGGQPSTLSAQFLDSIAPNNPLFLKNTEATGGDSHNTKAKEEFEKINGVDISGLIAHTSVVYDHILRGRTDAMADFFKGELLECIAPHGITTVANYYRNTPTIMKAWNRLYQRGDLPTRWGWWLAGGWGLDLAAEKLGMREQYTKFFYDDIGDFRGIGNDYIWNAGIANETGWESGIMCTKAKLPAGQTESPRTNPKGEILWDRVGPNCDEFQKTVDYDSKRGYARTKAALYAGLRIGFMHNYSDGTSDALLHMLDEAVANGTMTVDQIRALRISTEHDPIIRPDHVPRFAKYDMRPSFNGYQVQGNMKAGAFLQVYGEQYMNWIIPMKSLVDAGAHPVFNTDAHLRKDPVQWKQMDWPDQWDGNIWAILEFFVTRKMPNNGITYNRAESMDRVNLMRAATIWGAEQVLNEKNIGSLEVGKLADFLVMDKDFFTIPEDQIHTIKTVLTAVGGKVVYKDRSY